MSIVYCTSEIAKKAGVHPNTIRFYEELHYLPPVSRSSNGYRIFTDAHVEQLRFIQSIGLVYIISATLFGFSLKGSVLALIGVYLLVMVSIHSIGMVVASLAPQRVNGRCHCKHPLLSNGFSLWRDDSVRDYAKGTVSCGRLHAFDAGHYAAQK